MEGSHYIDIFATKGVEYLLVIGFLLCLVPFWWLLSQLARRSREPVRARAGATASSGWFRLPHGISYHPGHCWVRREEHDVVRVGIDDFAQHLLGVPTEIELPSVGQRLEQGARGLQVRFDSKSIDLLSPVAGEVLALNEEVLRSPGLINEDPYGRGWLLRIRVPRLKANLKNLLSGRLATVWMEETERALRGRMAGELGLLLQDGGEPVVGIARQLSNEEWEEVAAEFLLNG